MANGWEGHSREGEANWWEGHNREGVVNGWEGLYRIGANFHNFIFTKIQSRIFDWIHSLLA